VIQEFYKDFAEGNKKPKKASAAITSGKSGRMHGPPTPPSPSPPLALPPACPLPPRHLLLLLGRNEWRGR